jgi:hypothetical protein
MIRINDWKGKATLKAAVVVSVFLLLVVVAGFGQQPINLTAAVTTTTMPDGTTVPMWGYFCGAAVTGSTATCAALNPSSTATTPGTWSPVVITVPTGQGLTINLTNNLSFTPTGSTTANAIPTSIVIVGQVGGGLGSSRTATPSPSHTDAQGCTTWFIADPSTPPGTPCSTSTPLASPPAQGPRVQSMATEVVAGATTPLTWTFLKPGTYLLESGTHPSIQVPMGLIGMLVVTTAPSNGNTTAGTGYPASTTQAAVPYNAEVPLEFSEIDPVQNQEVDQAVRTAGFSETEVWSSMNNLQNVSVLTLTNVGSGYSAAPTVSIAGGGGSGATATATLSFAVASASVTSGGSGYAVGDTISLTGGGGTGAVATVATISGTGTTGPIATVTVSNGGSGYTTPPTNDTTLTGTGSGAVLATALATTGSVASVTITNGGVGYTSTPSVVISGGGGTGAAATASVTLSGCGTTHTCYPPAVNYTPFYYLINGLAFNKTNPAMSLFQATAGVSGTPPVAVITGITGTILARLVNASPRMHVPSIVGSLTQGFNGAGTSMAPVAGFTLIAEDGNVLPNVAPPGATTVPAAPRVQTDVFMAAGKTYDVMVNVPAASTTTGVTPALPIYDRQLSLSGNSSERDAGMLAYISVNNPLGVGLPVTPGTGVFAAAIARADTYNSLISGQPLTVSDPGKGVIANDTNVYGVTLLSPPSSGTVTCGLVGSPTGQSICANGTFTYTPSGTATLDSFSYCANNSLVPASGTIAAHCSSTNLMATVTLGPSNLAGGPTAGNITFTSKMATFLRIPSPGVLSVASDKNDLPLTVVTSGTHAPSLAGGTLLMDVNGGFTASVSGTGNAACPSGSPTGSNCFTFSYYVQNSQGVQSTSAGTATLVFPPPGNLQVSVVDAQQYANCNGNSSCISALLAAPMTDYRWIIEEDRTFWVDPNCTTNSSITTPGCPGVVGPSGQSTIPTFGVNFHTSAMNFVAQGCTGPLSCEYGQTMLDTRPACTNPPTNTIPAGCSATAGQHIAAVCDLGNGGCRPDPGNGTTSGGFAWVNPSQVALDPAKRYYISVLPGDAANPFPSYTGPPNCSQPGQCGHTMSGAPIPPACNVLGGPKACTTTSAFSPVTVLVLPTPLPTGKLSVIVFEDDYPLNGEQDGGGGNGTVAPIEPGLGSFNIVLWDTYGGLGDVTGQNSNDMFNQPLSNSLAGTIDPSTGMDACPISPVVTANVQSGDGSQQGITGMIVTCPKYESDNQTLSPLAGQAVIANLMPEKFSVQAYPGADRIARGEEWIQTNTLDGQHPHDSFIRIGEPSYFQEYGPAGYHVSIGFANPAIINARHAAVCAGAFGTVGACTATITGQIDVERLSRTPDQRLYPSGSRDALTWTQCWVSLGDPDAEDFMFTKCDANGNFTFNNVPGGNWRLTIGDQWNDQIIDGLSTPANVVAGQTLNMGSIGVQQWQSNLYTRTFLDANKNGIWDAGDLGIPLIYTRISYRDGHNSNGLTTDFNGVANFNETFPLFNWYVVEADTTRYKRTGTHTVYDAGGPADGSPSCGTLSNGARSCGTSTAFNFLANTFEAVPLPADLSVPGAVYCAKADCAAEAASFAAGTAIASPGKGTTASTGRIDPPWVWAEGWSGMTSQGNFIDFGMAPYASCPPACATVTVTPPGGTTPTTTQVAENGGIYGKVIYASTRPFDSAQQMIQQPWEPNVPHVTINLYQEGFAADGVTPTLTMVDTTQTSSWDDWAQGFYPNYTDPTTHGPLPYMSCPGQGTNTGTNQDLFYFTLFDQPNYLDWYNSVHNGGTLHTLPYNSQYKCYDAMHIWNQVQPAPYDGKYSFPSSLGINPATGKPVTTMGSTNGVASNMPGTNCTVCLGNPDSSDPYRVGTPMLPPGKYVVQVIMPPGYEVYKEEDKNLLIGDNYIAPVTEQFAGLGGDIFIIPDQASVASLYEPNAAGYNPNNFQNQTTDLSLQAGLSGVPGFPGFVDPNWPCVGEMRVVPDFLSIFPQVQEVAPFAGATRPLCDRKEVTLANQMSVDAKFFIYTSTHIASKFTGVITDDFTAEFDPFAPQFGEKFSPPNLPISTKDYLGNEISRVYSDHWGIYDGLTFSSWEVNPPNITGYSPSMMVQCMNDPGPIPDPNHPGQMITDPLYNAAYSDFCYQEPYMPGLTAYLDTPVVPTQAFVGAAYNNTDCSYPDTTPAIKEADGTGLGPWVNAAGATLTITALGDQQVNNNAYAGPSANVAPFNSKTITRHYGFGAQCTSTTTSSATCNTLSSVTIGGVNAIITGWTDTAITVTVPGPTTTCTTASSTCNPTPVPSCAIQQQAQYGGSAAQCGQLVITAGNGKQSVDTVTVTVGGKAPFHHVAASESIQSWIDQAAPGDLIMVDPGAHTEMLIMWKPVRLQGVGAATSIINANVHPAGKLLDPWRRHINCLFGLTLAGVPNTGAGTGTGAYDPTGTYTCPDTGWLYFNAQPNVPQIDRLPLEATVGWDATLNGNLAEQLQEPSLMGAYEGAGITVLAKGLDFHGAVPWTDGNEGGAFPAGTTLLTGVGPNPAALPVGDANRLCVDGTGGANRFPSNFTCNPSSIDGLSVINSSQGGGGIFAHGWAHHLQIANNRVYNNAGTLSGGISVGQGEFASPYVQGGTTNAPPGSCSDGTGFVANQHLPYCLQLAVNVHNNFVTNNSSLGDELFSATLAGGGGLTFCTGNDYYKFNYNWVCGNISTGEGGGLAHLGEIQNGDIQHNSIVFNQSDNPTIPTNGGGIQIMGTPDTDPTCGTQIDADCPPGLSDGTGHNLTINANLIQGNSADNGSGGGIRLQQINGTEVSTFFNRPALWNNVSITNNIIVNNVAGWDGAGISLQDSLNVAIVNNTIVSNDSLASSGVLTFSIGAPLASAPPGECHNTAGTASCPQSAGVTSTPNSSLLTTTFTGLTITCPTGQPNCTGFSNPLLVGNVIWQNRSFFIGVGNLGQGNQNQQKLVSLFDAFTGTASPVQTAFGQCTSPVSYWDIGVRGDTGPSNHVNGFTLGPAYSVLDDPADYPGRGNSGSNPNFISQSCNGSRVPPTCTVAEGCGGPSGYGVPPGIVDALAPNPVFSLTPAATVDEGNNWINVSWGPLSLSDDSVLGADGNYGGGAAFGNYVLTAGSPAVDYIPCSNTGASLCTIVAIGGLPSITLPTTDFFGNPRPDAVGTTSGRNCNPNTPGHACVDVGAVEATGAGVVVGGLSVAPTALAFGSVGVGTNSAAQTLTLSNTGGTAATGITLTFTGPYSRPAGGAGGGCGGTLAAGATCTINVQFSPTATGAAPGSLAITASVAVQGSPVALTGTGVPLPTISSFNPSSGARGDTFTVTVTGTNFAAPATMFHPGSNGPVITNVVVVNATTATATFTVPTTSALGGHCVDITTPAGTSPIGPPCTSLFNVTPLMVSFTGPTPALTTGGPSGTATRTGLVTVSNVGTGSITFSAAPTIAKVGTAGGTFSIISGGTCTATTVLAAGTNCTVNVQYVPGGSTATAMANVTATWSGGLISATSANFAAN